MQMHCNYETFVLDEYQTEVCSEPIYRCIYELFLGKCYFTMLFSYRRKFVLLKNINNHSLLTTMYKYKWICFFFFKNKYWPSVYNGYLNLTNDTANINELHSWNKIKYSKNPFKNFAILRRKKTSWNEKKKNWKIAKQV